MADALAAREAVLRGGFAPWEALECKHHEWPGTWMACRDQAFVAFQGEFAKCSPSPGQSGCGFRGVSCCETFWGWAEKLEYFTGRRWDLPCDCGLGSGPGGPGCVPDPAGARADGSACCHHASNASAGTCDRVARVEDLPDVNPPEDTHTYTSAALAELDARSGAPAAFWRSCRQSRQLRFADARMEETALECHRLASRYLLLKGNLRALGEWARFAHGLRRRPGGGPDGQVVVRAALAADTGDADDASATRGKVEHDLAQLRHLGALPSLGAAAAARLGGLVPRYEALRAALGAATGGAAQLAALAGFYNRALHVPPCAAAPGALRAGALAGAEAALAERGFAVVDGAVGEAQAASIQAWLAEATVWHGSRLGGRVLEASLLDGLHCEALLGLAGEVAASEALRAWAGGPLVLQDARAWKSEPGLAGTTWPGAAAQKGHLLLACLWLTPDGADGAGSSLRLGAGPDEVGHRRNRMVLWEPRLRNATWRFGGWREDYGLRRVDLVLAFRRSRGRRGFPGAGAPADA